MEKTKKQNSNLKKKFLLVFWGAFGAFILFAFLLFTFINLGWIGYLPPIDELQNPKNKFATEIFSSDLKVLGHFYISDNNRVGVDYSEISDNVVKALIATEDIRFYDHSGIDGKGLARAVAYMGKAGGGSTITQQLAKLLYSGDRVGGFQRIVQKLNEWVIAVKLEYLYSKEEIVTMYLNQFDFVNNAVGIKSAAQVYFNTTPSALTIEEAATLVGMCKNPWLYNPYRFNERSKGRRNIVLNQMFKADFITKQEFDSISQLPLTLDFKRPDHKEGLAPYFREYLRGVLTAKEPKRGNYAGWQEQKFQDDSWEWNNNPLFGFFEKNKKPDGTSYNLYHDGLKIYTTIDSRMQTYAEEAVDEHIRFLQKEFFKEKRNRTYAPFSKNLTTEEINGILDRSMKQSERYRLMRNAGHSEAEIRKAFNTPVEMEVFTYAGYTDTLMSPIDSIRYQKHFLRCGFMSVDAHSGHVKAYVGGPNFSAFQYDMATQGRRQVGSTVKPFLYTLAMGEGMSPCDQTRNEEITLLDGMGQPWTPRNDSKNRIGDIVTLRWGLATSNNWISAYLMSLFSPQSLVNLMRSFGIKGQLDPVVSLCLGPCEISVAEMVNAYTAYPNKGIRIDPLYVTRIEDADGRVIATFTPKMYEILSESTSYKMISMLQGVMNGGTGTRIRTRYGLTMPAGGKTGTTQNNSDGWFIGFTPSLVSGAWVGGEDRAIHFDTMLHGQGASMALPIWALYMKKVLADSELGYLPTEQFEIPAVYQSYADCEVVSTPGVEVIE